MIEIELCRICLADSIRMYPIEHTRYHEVFEWYTEDTMDMNDELPYSVCYFCNAVLNKVYDFLKNMIDTEIYLKETLRNTSKLTYESVEKLKREMISKPHNLSRIWLRNSNFIALDAFKRHRPPRALRRYFEHPPIMIEYHKPYEHMKLEDIPEEQELEKRNEDEPEETKEAETENIKEAETEEIKEAETEEIKEAETELQVEVETEPIKEAESEEIKDRETPQQKLKLPEQESKSPHRAQKESSENIYYSDEKSPQNEDQQILYEENFKNQPDNTDNDSEATADQDEFPNNDGEIISMEEIITLETTPEIENESPNIPNMEIDDEPFIENNNSSDQSKHKSESSFSNKRNKTLDPIDSFLLCAKKYRPPEELAKSSYEYVTKEAVRTKLAKNHNPYIEFFKKRLGIEKEPQEKKVKTARTVKFHNPYLQFIEERIETEEKPQEKKTKTSEQRLKTLHPGKYQSQNLHIIEHIPETEPEQTARQMEMDKNIHTTTPLLQQKSTDVAVVQIEEKYYNLYHESVKEKPFKVSNEPLVIEKLTPVRRGPTKPVSKLTKPTTENKPATLIVTSEPKKYLNSYVNFVKDIGYGSIENAGKLIKTSNEIPIPPKNTKKSDSKKFFPEKIVPVTPVQEPSEKIDIEDGQISGYCYFNHQKRYRRASILKKTCHPHKNQRKIQQLATKIKNRAATIRKELRKFQKTDLNAKKIVQENAVTKLASNDECQPGITELEEENSPTHLPLKSKEHSDKLPTIIPLKLPQDNKNRIVWRVVEYPVKSKHTDRASNEPKDQNQGDQVNAQVTLKDQAGQKLTEKNDGIFLEDQEDANNQMWSDQEDNTIDSQVDRAIKVLDESLQDEDTDSILRNKENPEHNLQNNHTLTHKNYPPLQIKDVIIEEDVEDINELNDQDNPTLVVHNVFTLKDQGSEHEDLIDKEQYDQIIMLANQDDQVMEDGNVAVKIESVDEDIQGSFEKEHEEENVLSDTETFYNEDTMDPNNDSDDIVIQQDDIKVEVEQNMQIDEEASEYEPYLQERVSLYESTTRRERDGPSNYNNPNFESNYNDIQGLNEQEHYTMRSISQITSVPTVQLERLPIDLFKKTNRENSSSDENGKYSCKLCDFKTKVRRVFLRHQNIHDLDKKFVCNICQHRFMSRYHLSRHKVTHDRTKYYCSYCDFKTTIKLTMEKHEKEHSKLNRYPCLFGCHRRFRSFSHRSTHLCTKYLRKCQVCNELFKSETRFTRHLYKHDVVPVSYKCSLCSKSFDTEKKCSNHCKQHGLPDSEKKYTCKWCKKTFSYKSNCTKHMKLHEKKQKKVSHETENKLEMYETDDEVELHEKERIVDEKFVCSLCPQLFDTETELGQHAVDHIL